MADTETKSSGTWRWVIAGIIVAAIAVAIIFYIGWFDNNTHVDTPAGDNVEQQYEITEAQSEAPGEADWQNADGQSLDELVTEPASQTQTPPSE